MNDAYTNLISELVRCTQYVADGIIVWGGLNWMFGNRTKAIEYLVGFAIGYTIVLNHVEIREFFETLLS